MYLHFIKFVKNKPEMNHLRFLLTLLILGQSILSAQTDSAPKRHTPSGLIDAAPFAIKKEDFKPQINLTVQTVDSITNSPVDSRFDYYVSSDTLVKVNEGGTSLSFNVNRNKNIIVLVNSPGYMIQSVLISRNAESEDTVCIVKMKKCNKGDALKLFYYEKQGSLKYESLNRTALEFFLKLNPKIKINLSSNSKEKGEKTAAYLRNKSYKNRFSYENSKSNIKGQKEYILIKIRSI